MSPYCRAFYEDMPHGNEQKLVPNLLNKHKYVVHHRNLQLYVKLGMRVTKTHRALGGSPITSKGNVVRDWQAFIHDNPKSKLVREDLEVGLTAQRLAKLNSRL